MILVYIDMLKTPSSRRISNKNILNSLLCPSLLLFHSDIFCISPASAGGEVEAVAAETAASCEVELDEDARAVNLGRGSG